MKGRVARSCFALSIVLGGLRGAQTQVQAGTQAARVYTPADYAAAERFMQYNVDPLVYHTVAHIAWLGDGRFWYRDAGPGGATYILVDAARRTKVPAFDHAKVAAALNEAIRSGAVHTSIVATLDAGHLPIDALRFEDDDKRIVLTLGHLLVRCDLRGKGGCSAAGDTLAGRPAEPYDVSPDGKRAAFLRDNNLWVKESESGQETQLTTDGVPDYGYATDNAGWTHSANPILVWSPDSKKIATFQQDQRKVGRMTLVNTMNGHPRAESWRYPLAGDPVVTKIERVVIDVDARKVVGFKMPADEHRSSVCDDLSCAGGHGWDDVQWSDDSGQVAFVSTARDHRQEWLRVADAATGEVREVLHETAATYLAGGIDTVNWRVLWSSGEVLWYSERDDWGQMYLYDLATGTLKNQVTRGPGNVTQVLRVNAAGRAMYFLAEGKEAGWNPYLSALYRVGLDGSGLKLLTPEEVDHVVSLAPQGTYFVDVGSTAVMPGVAVVRDNEGKLVEEVARQDITALEATGWKPPVAFTMKARDGMTDLYGLMFKPTGFDALKKYPVVDRVYPGPQPGSPCGPRGFAAARGDMQALAELGFVVMCLDGMGTAERSKSFHDAHYGDMGDYTIPDQVAGIRQLAAMFPWVDATRVGVWGHSGGGAAAAAAMFHFPDFFKVGVSESGNHDNRLYEDDWGEKWQGLLTKDPDGTTNYDGQANQRFAKNLKGHLLLVHGTMDDNVPPNNTLLVVDALIKANKDFDLLMIPNAGHGYGAEAPYVMRRRWDYFVRYLGDAVPPVEYRMKDFIEP